MWTCGITLKIYRRNFFIDFLELFYWFFGGNIYNNTLVPVVWLHLAHNCYCNKHFVRATLQDSGRATLKGKGGKCYSVQTLWLTVQARRGELRWGEQWLRRFRTGTPCLPVVEGGWGGGGRDDKAKAKRMFGWAGWQVGEGELPVWRACRRPQGRWRRERGGAGGGGVRS